MLRVLSYVFAIAMILLGVDALMVAFGGGVSVRFAGFELRSTTIELPVISFLVAGFVSLLLLDRWREAILLCGALVVTGLVTELALRVTDHPFSKAHIDYSNWYRPSEYVGHELVPDFEGFGPLNVPVTINHDGFRDANHLKEKSPGTLRVLGLGDSFMFGWGVSAGETFLKQLERQLAGRMDRAIETINTGVPGWGLNQYYVYLKRAGGELAADVVIVAYFVDDLNGPLQDFISPSTQYAQGLKFKDGGFHYSRLFNFLKSMSHLVRERNRPARVAYLHDLDQRRADWSQRAHYLMAQSNVSDSDKYVDMLSQHLQRIRAIVALKKASLVVMYIPDISQLHHPEAQLINGTLHRLCQEIGIPFVDMTPVFEQSQDPGTYYLWPKDPHTNARGHAEMARALEQLICGLQDLKPSCKDASQNAQRALPTS